MRDQRRGLHGGRIRGLHGHGSSDEHVSLDGAAPRPHHRVPFTKGFGRLAEDPRFTAGRVRGVRSRSIWWRHAAEGARGLRGADPGGRCRGGGRRGHRPRGIADPCDRSDWTRASVGSVSALGAGSAPPGRTAMRPRWIRNAGDQARRDQARGGLGSAGVRSAEREDHRRESDRPASRRRSRRRGRCATGAPQCRSETCQGGHIGKRSATDAPPRRDHHRGHLHQTRAVHIMVSAAHSRHEGNDQQLSSCTAPAPRPVWPMVREESRAGANAVESRLRLELSAAVVGPSYPRLTERGARIPALGTGHGMLAAGWSGTLRFTRAEASTCARPNAIRLRGHGLCVTARIYAWEPTARLEARPRSAAALTLPETAHSNGANGPHTRTGLTQQRRCEASGLPTNAPAHTSLNRMARVSERGQAGQPRTTRGSAGRGGQRASGVRRAGRVSVLQRGGQPGGEAQRRASGVRGGADIRGARGQRAGAQQRRRRRGA